MVEKNIYRKMLRFLSDEKFWLKEETEWIRNDYILQNCLIGAALRVSGMDTNGIIDLPDLSAVIIEQFPDRLGRYSDDTDCGAVPSFNDHDDTTFAEVRLVLEKAAIRLEEKIDADCGCI